MKHEIDNLQLCIIQLRTVAAVFEIIITPKSWKGQIESM